MRIFSTLWLVLSASLAAANNIELFWNLYDAVISGGRILHDVAEGVGAVSKAIRAIDCFLDSTAEAQITEALAEAEAAEAAETDAEKVDAAVPDQPPGSAPAPSFNGCGALGFHIRGEHDGIPVEQLTACCPDHEQCYGAACRANKRQCDYKLRQCLFGACEDRSLARDRQKSCKAAAKLLFSGTMALSQAQYYAAQGQLQCSRKRQTKGKRGR